MEMGWGEMEKKNGLLKDERPPRVAACSRGKWGGTAVCLLWREDQGRRGRGGYKAARTSRKKRRIHERVCVPRWGKVICTTTKTVFFVDQKTVFFVDQKTVFVLPATGFCDFGDANATKELARVFQGFETASIRIHFQGV